MRELLKVPNPILRKKCRPVSNFNKAYFDDGQGITVYCKDSRDMCELANNSIDLIATDPPYGISFMGKDWDRALPDKTIWAECLRILKLGAFAFVMSIPRADCLSRMIIALEDAGFWVNFTPIFHAFASGFPKAQNIGKAVDKRLGKERKIIGTYKTGYSKSQKECGYRPKEYELKITEPEPLTPQAKALDGSYGGFQPKPAVEVIIVAMKPLSEKTFVGQALKNGKGITWLDDCRIPYESDYDKSQATPQGRCTGQVYDSMLGRERKEFDRPEQRGRFPANLLVSDDVLDDGRVTKSTSDKKSYLGLDGTSTFANKQVDRVQRGDSGSFSRYFDLDKWWQERIKQLPESVRRTFPFLIVPKASKGEKNRGIGVAVPRTKHGSTPRKNEAENKSPNYHPTVKPVKLMSYLITLGSREGDMVVDPFIGTGSTAIACQILDRSCTGYEIKPAYCEIAKRRLSIYRQRVMSL